MEDQPEGFHTTFDVDKKNITDSDEDFDEIVINFVGIKTSCSKCHSSIPLRSKLYKYIKVGCVREA